MTVKLQFTCAQRQILLDALMNRETTLLKYAEMYKNNGDREGQIDCLKERREAADLFEAILHGKCDA